METEKYRALLAAVDRGSLTGAAEELDYTPSGISRMIAVLEEEAGFPLLRRGRTGVVPTAECGRLLPQIRDIVRAERNYTQLTAEVRGLHTGSINIGTSMDACFPFLSRLAAEFSAAYPGIRVDINEGLSAHLARAVEDGRADFAIISRRDGDFRWIPLTCDPLVALVPLTGEYAGLESLPVRALAEMPFIDIYHSDETDNALMFERLGIRPKTRYACTNCFAAAAMVEAGLGVTTENRMIASRWESRVKILPLEPPQLIEIGIAAPRKEHASPAASRFLEFAEQALASDPELTARQG